MRHDPEEDREKIEGLVARYCAGEFSTEMFSASLKVRGMRRDDVDEMIKKYLQIHVNSRPYRRGDVQ